MEQHESECWGNFMWWRQNAELQKEARREMKTKAAMVMVMAMMMDNVAAMCVRDCVFLMQSVRIRRERSSVIVSMHVALLSLKKVYQRDDLGALGDWITVPATTVAMNLATLWSHERARVGIQVDEVGSPTRATRSGSLDVSASIAEERGDRHRASSRVPHSSLSSSTPVMAALPGSQQQHQQQASVPVSTAMVSPKRRITVFAKREVIFKKLVDESVVPAVNAVAAVQNFFDCNEFAMEYADRAPKRFYTQSSSSTACQQQSSSAVSVVSGAGGGATAASNTLTISASGTAIASLLRKEKKGLSTSTPRAVQNAAQSSINSSSSGSSAAVSSAAAAGASNVGLMSVKPSFLSRKNGRKKLTPDFSNTRAFRPYVGDMFGTRGEYIDGMLYMSRMKRSLQITFGSSSGGSSSSASWIDLPRSEGRHVLKDAVSDALSAAISATSAAVAAPGKTGGGGSLGSAATSASTARSVLSNRSDFGEDPESLQTKQRRRCSLTLSNWSSNPENAVLMVQENVVEALILLCKANDSVTRLNCVTALMNLSHVVELRQIIVRQGAVKTVSEIVDETEDKTLRTACAITLCNLCCLEGEEEVLVEDGAVSALSVLITEQPKVSWLCRSALFNLTCVREPYQKIESVLKMFITLTTSSGGASSEGCDEITAKALCNLSNFKRIRLRLMEEGIVNAISSLIHMNTPDIQEMLAYVMLNLSALKACRSEMVAKGCMGTLVSLTGATSASAAKILIASTLFNLSKEPGNRLRMVFEGLLLLVNELCRGSMVYAGGETLRTVCARTLYNISCNEDTRVKLVERDGVSILSSLSRRTNDSDAKKMCTLALCNLLGVQQAAADIMNAGAITALIQLSMTPDQTLETKRLFSKALHGLCEQSETRDAVTRAGVIPAILYLSSIGEGHVGNGDGVTDRGSPREKDAGDSRLISEIRARCTAALACLAADEGLSIHVCNLQVVLCVTKILVLERSHVAIERFCCSCLSLLCRDEECSQIMADEGAIEVVLSTCMETQDLETKASCCHVLASMSCHPSCCMALVRMGVISVLATLAKIKEDKGIQRCCAITLANLSVEPSIRDILVTAGIVKILSMLSNSYSEESQRDCAKVLCNLSCVPGNEAHLVSEGAIGVLVMISMVRAVNASTKETCARAMFNLLNAETIKAMVQDGFVKILPAFATLELGSACEVVTMVFMKLIGHPIGRNALCVEWSALKSLFALMESSTVGTSSSHGSQGQSMQLLFENLLCELVFYENSRLPSVNTGIIDALHKITMRDTISTSQANGPSTPSSCSAKRLALVLFTLSKYDETRMAVASSASIATLTAFLKRHPPMPAVCESGECVVFAVSTFCSLAWHGATRGRLEHPDISRILVQLLTVDSPESTFVDVGQRHCPGYYPTPAIKTTLLTLCCLSQSQELLQAMLNDRIIDCLYGILSQDSPKFSQQNLPLIQDQEFLALGCILFRQLSHAPLFSSMVENRGSLIIPLFCALTQLVADSDPDSCLDCADALCSVTFAAVKTAQQSSAGSKRDQTACSSLVSPNVVKAIESLMWDSQLPETRWRCAASLWALSLIPEYRSRLVALGCTRILVGESYRTESSAYLSILKCCAGALCNFTISLPSLGDAMNANAAKMVKEDAVPALLQLSKLENAEVREHCTLALTNLSDQSPKVESGAVSALLNLSLQATSPMSSASSVRRPRSAAIPPHLSETLCRPPVVCGDRHKQFSKLPEFVMEIERNESLSERKYEADLVASTPPPPHLPTIPVGLDSSSEQASNNTNEPDELLQMRASMVSEGGEDGASGASGSRDRDSIDKRSSSLLSKSFPKVDPSESRLLGGGSDADDGNDDSSNSQQDLAATSQETGRDTDANDSEENRNNADGDQEDLGEQGETVGQLRKGILHKGNSSNGSGYSLSPLARVVVRKTQASQAAKKLKELRRKWSDGSLASPSSNSNGGGPGSLPPSRGNSINRNIGSTGKSGRAMNLAQGRSFEDLLSATDPNPSIARGASESKRDEKNCELSMDARSSLAAAAAAARLYGETPAGNSTGNGNAKVTTKKRQQSAKEKLKPKAKASLIAKYLPVSPSGSEDEDEYDGSLPATNNDGDSDTLPMATTSAMADFRAQAKKFGLWS